MKKKELLTHVKKQIAWDKNSSLVKKKHLLSWWNKTAVDLCANMGYRNYFHLFVNQTNLTVGEFVDKLFNMITIGEDMMLSPDEQKVFLTLTHIIHDLVGVGQTIRPTSTTADVGADSLDLIEFIMAIEENYDIEIPDATAERFDTVKDVVDYIIKTKEQ